MILNDLKIFEEPLFFYERDFVDLSKYMFSPTKDKTAYPIIIKELCKTNYGQVFDLTDGGEDEKCNQIIRNLLKYNKVKEYNAPYELQARLYILKEYAKDFTLYPTFYSQEFLDIIKYYTVERTGMKKSVYTFKKLAEKIFDCDLNFVNYINLKTPSNDCGRGLGEIFIHGAGIAIMPKDFLEKMSSREMINSLVYKDGVGLNTKMDGRKLITRVSSLDWRSNDSKGDSF